jgi:hypothetical protein
VSRSGGKTKVTKSKDGTDSGKKAAGGVPLLKKKPPPPSSEEGETSSPPPSASSAKPSVDRKVEKMTFQLGDIDLDAEHKRAKSHDYGDEGGDDDDDDDDDDSGGAVYEGTEEQWATEFDTK